MSGGTICITKWATLPVGDHNSMFFFLEGGGGGLKKKQVITIYDVWPIIGVRTPVVLIGMNKISSYLFIRPYIYTYTYRKVIHIHIER